MYKFAVQMPSYHMISMIIDEQFFQLGSSSFLKQAFQCKYFELTYLNKIVRLGTQDLEHS